MPGSELHTPPHLSLIPSLGVRIIVNSTLHTGKQSLREWTSLAQVKTASGGHDWDLNLHLTPKLVFSLSSVSCESIQAPEFGERVVMRPSAPTRPSGPSCLSQSQAAQTTRLS